MYKNNNDLLQELFAMPVNPQLVAKIDGSLKLYSSSNLVNKYKTSIASNKYTSSSFKFLDNLINKQNIIPVYLTKNLLSYSFSKIFTNSSMRGVNAFYSPRDDKIFILIDNNTKYGFMDDNWVGKLTIHECMHMACSHGKNKFLNLFKEDYFKFYNIFFHLLCNKKFTNESTKSIYKLIDNYMTLFHNAECNKTDLKRAITKDGNQIFYNILLKLDIDKKDASQLKDGYEELLTLFVKYSVKGIIHALTIPSCKYIMMSLNKTYPVLTSEKINTLAIQELIFPSEITAVFSELGLIKNKIPKAVSMIKVK